LFEEDAAMAPQRTPEKAAHIACSSGNLFREEIQGGGEGIFSLPSQSRINVVEKLKRKTGL